MKTIFYLISLVIALSSTAHTTAQTASNLDATSFASKIKQTSTAQIIDVRTAREFSQGHIQDAQNINISSSDFEAQVLKLNKLKPVFLYCLSGSRSSYAMNALRSLGFKEIYNLSGGMMRWRAANLPETTDNTVAKSAKPEMTMAQYQAMLNSKKLVLVDFYADWCAPCQKMKPYLDEISNEMKTNVVVVRIDADANKTLAKQLKVQALPVLFLYKNNKIVWSKNSLATKEELTKQINKFR